ncbi:MAG: hypothetical protein V4813_16430 [Gemmatimonadota bacterium]
MMLFIALVPHEENPLPTAQGRRSAQRTQRRVALADVGCRSPTIWSGLPTGKTGGAPHHATTLEMRHACTPEPPLRAATKRIVEALHMAGDSH